MNNHAARATSASYQLFMLALSLYALGALALQTVFRLDSEMQSILDYADVAVCALFLADFAISLATAPDRVRYLATWGWLDLLSSIPALDAARWGRAARVVRVLRVLRGLRATRVIAALVLRRRAESTFLAASLISLLLVVFCSVAVLHFEAGAEANIKTAEDAIWWAIATITTVGYGDRYPVTGEGRLIAGILMCAGVGLFGTFSGFLAAWFIGSPSAASPAPEATDEIARLREEVRLVRDEVARLTRGAPGAEPPPADA